MYMWQFRLPRTSSIVAVDHQDHYMYRQAVVLLDGFVIIELEGDYYYYWQCISHEHIPRRVRRMGGGILIFAI